MVSTSGLLYLFVDSEKKHYSVVNVGVHNTRMNERMKNQSLIKNLS